MECTFCGMPLRGDDPDLVWSDGQDREPFCNVECEVAELADRTISEAGNRRRKNWRRRVARCSRRR